MCGIAPFIGIKMASFDWLMTLYHLPRKSKSGNRLFGKSDPKYERYFNLINGALAGTIAVTATYPTDLLRRLMHLNGSPGHSYTGLADAMG